MSDGPHDAVHFEGAIVTTLSQISMPELPEVETTKRGIAPFLESAQIRRLVVRNPALRWPIPSELPQKVVGKMVESVDRRGKYLLLRVAGGSMLVHLGMSGSLRVLQDSVAPTAHDHFDLETRSGDVLRYRDPRRFGCLLWQDGDPMTHPLLRNLGVEPLSSDFDGELLWRLGHDRRTAIKNIIMNGQIVVGVGNIYASEALHGAGIHPQRSGRRISRARYQNLADAIRAVLERAIAEGGTTLRDFTSADGNPVYFHQSLKVYDRQGASCGRCGSDIRKIVTGQRATYYCPGCQR